jgi:hypothetical protein
MDEFTEAIMLIQTLRQAYFPVILMCSDYWDGLIKWMRQKMLQENQHISPEDLNVFTLCDEPQKAADIILEFHRSGGKSGLQEPTGLKPPQ